MLLLRLRRAARPCRASAATATKPRWAASTGATAAAAAASAGPAVASASPPAALRPSCCVAELSLKRLAQHDDIML